MDSHKIQIDFKPGSGIEVHYKRPGAMVEVLTARNQIELYQMMLEISRRITDDLPQDLLIPGGERTSQIEELTRNLRVAFRARAGIAAGGFGALNALDPMPHLPGLLKDPAAGCKALAILVNELMENGGRFDPDPE